jgi:hypothetical protein
VDAGADPHDELDVVLDQQDRHPLVGQLHEQPGEVVGLALVEAGRGLVEEQDLRSGRERASQLDEPSQPGGHGVNALVGHRADADTVEEVLDVGSRVDAPIV